MNEAEQIDLRRITRAVYSVWRAWALMRNHKTKAWEDETPWQEFQVLVDRIEAFSKSPSERTWKPFPQPSMVGGKDVDLQVELRHVAQYLLKASPVFSKKEAAKPPPLPKKEIRFCPICEDSGTIGSHGAGPEPCPRLDEPWHKVSR